MNIRKLTALSMLTSAALIIFVIESKLPPLAPVPGIKIGLANIVTLITLSWFGRKESFIVLMLRIILGSIFTGQMISFMYSLAGGITCLLVMSLMMKMFKDKLWLVSILGALAHNMAQIAVAMAVTATWQVVFYLPLLALCAVITGAFVGIAAGFVVKRRDVFLGRDNF